MTLALEVAVQDAAGVRVARELGAARVELAQALPLGGLTPSPATLAQAVAAAGEGGPEVHVLIRPRAGGFQFSAEELAAIDLGFTRVLTSGGASAAIDGLETLRALVGAAEGRIQIMAGSGVNAQTVVEIAATGVHAVHFSAKRTLVGQGDVRMGSASDGVGGHDVTDLAQAKAVRDALGL